MADSGTPESVQHEAGEIGSLSSSHKRTGGGSPGVFGAAPEAKRLMFDFDNLPALADESLPPPPTVGNDADEEEDEEDGDRDIRGETNGLRDQSNTALRQLIFHCDMTADFEPERQANGQIGQNVLQSGRIGQLDFGSPPSPLGSSDVSRLRSLLLLNTEGSSQTGGPTEDPLPSVIAAISPPAEPTSDVNVNVVVQNDQHIDGEEDEDNKNIANTSAFIGALLNIVGGDSFNESFLSDENLPVRDPSNQEFIGDNKFEANVTTKSIGTDAMQPSKPVNDAEVPHFEDEDDSLLNNLPTSVDDFQEKEFHLKLGRNLSSPLMTLNSPAPPPPSTTTPAGVTGPCHGPSVFTFGCEASTSTGAHTVCRSLSGNGGEFFGCGSAIGSRTMSNASDNAFLDAVDPNDLEVAMINESFEEKQKQSEMYARKDLRTLFYSIPSESSDDLDPANKIFFSDMPIDPNEPSTSSMGMYFDGETPNMNVSGDTVDMSAMDAMVAAALGSSRHDSLSADVRTVSDDEDETIGDTAIDVDENGEGPCCSGVDIRSTTPANNSDHFFIPVMTPTTRQIILQQRKSFARTGKYRIPTMAPAASIASTQPDAEPEENGFPNGYPLLDPLLFERGQDQNANLLENGDRNVGEGDKMEENEADLLRFDDSHEDGIAQKHMRNNNVTSTTLKAITSADSDELTADAKARMVAYGVVRSLFDSPVFMEEAQNVVTSTPKSNTNRLPRFNVQTVRRCGALFNFDGENEAEISGSSGAVNSAGDDLAGVAEEDGSIELSTVDMADGTADFSHSSSRARLLFDEDADEFDETEKFKGLNLNTTGSSAKFEDRGANLTLGSLAIQPPVIGHNNEVIIMTATVADEDEEVTPPVLAPAAAPPVFSSASSSMSSFSVLDKASKDASLCGDEQAVPVLDSWEHLDEDDELAARVLNEAKAKATAQKAAELQFGGDAEKNSAAYEENVAFEELAHVLEARCAGAVPRTEEEVANAVRVIGGSDDVWHRKLDAKNYLVIFPSAEQASHALFTKQTVTFLHLSALISAAAATRSAAVAQKSHLLPRRRRPATTVTVARRMIANSLNMRIDVPPEQRDREIKQMAAAKESQRQKKAIWDGN